MIGMLLKIRKSIQQSFNLLHNSCLTIRTINTVDSNQVSRYLSTCSLVERDRS